MANAVSRGILKAMGLFGGQQVVSILCAIVRTKLIAVWLGPMGVGLIGIYYKAVDMISLLSNMGIRSSSVRDISIAFATGDRKKVAEIVKIVRRWTWALGIAWACIMLAISPWLSQVSFGNYDHTWAYMALSVCVFVISVANCEQAVLQGVQKLKPLAKSMVWGIVAGLVVSIPMYYYLRMDSIVPSILAFAFAGTILAWIYRCRDYNKEKVELTVRQTISGGAEFVKLGICITASGFLTQFVSYLFLIYLNKNAGINEVGLYQAGDALVNRYAILLFSAIGLEYYPRLASVCANKLRLRVFVGQEANITLYILVPVIVLFLLFRELIVNILYSSDFQAMIPFISWCMVGMVFKGVSWCLAYVILAKGSSKLYLVTEGVSDALCLVLNIVFYELWGLTGLGISYVVWYASYLLISGIVYFGIFKLTLHRSVWWHTVYALAVALAALWAIEVNNYFVIIALAVATMTFSFIKIRKSIV